jgi:cobalt-zinc-cadmium efflux system protein
MCLKGFGKPSVTTHWQRSMPTAPVNLIFDCNETASSPSFANLLAFAAGLGFLWTLRYYDMQAFLGVRQWQQGSQNVADQEPFPLSPVPRYVRHPWYFCRSVNPVHPVIMAHQHHHPAHSEHRRGDNERRVFVAMLLTGGFMGVEVIGGLLSGSLALLADAGHMLTDFASLALSWFSFRISRRPADPNRSYGYHRFEVLAALVNGVALFAIVAGIGYTAIQRLLAPVEVIAVTMLGVAVLGLVVNVLALGVLTGGDRSNLNIRGAAAHVLGDLLGSLAAIAAAGIILWTGWMPIDPLLSLLVCLLILKSAWGIARDSVHILLEGTPQEMDIDRLSAELQQTVAEVQDVHHVHVWALTPQRWLLTLHITVARDSNQDLVLQQVKRFLEQRWGVQHSTIQIERAACPDQTGGQDQDC